MILRRLTQNLRTQNWTAITIELFIVVAGVFIGTQVSNWNEARSGKAATERMLAQLAPELRSEVKFFDDVKVYYATTRHYADQALAGWNRDPAVSDEQFVIAAYQASQINGIGINPDSWSLTFGGGQLRNIENPKIRRKMEIMLTADYTPVEFNAVATRYREQVRQIIPVDIQDKIRSDCGDRNVRDKDGVLNIVLPRSCALRLDPAEAAATAAALRARPDLIGELRWHLAAVATYLANVDSLSLPIRELHRELSAS